MWNRAGYPLFNHSLLSFAESTLINQRRFWVLEKPANTMTLCKEIVIPNVEDRQCIVLKPSGGSMNYNRLTSVGQMITHWEAE